MRKSIAIAAVAVLCMSPLCSAAAQEKRQAATNDAEFSSAAAQLISLYVPASVASVLASAASAASVTGNIDSIIQSAVVAESTPSWLAAVPTQYQPNIQSLDAAISALKGAASTGIPGAPRVITSTDAAGSVFVTTTPGSSAASVSAAMSLSSLASSESSAAHSNASGASSAATSGQSVASSRAASTRTTSATAAPVASSTSSGFAAPTLGCVHLGLTGIIGVLGAIAAL